MNYYNDNDQYCVGRLRNLIAEGLIPRGDVDDRDIQDISPRDLGGYAQCHFFAGIGGWARALQLAGVSGTEQLWTGSCPCQPFSSAGKRTGVADIRHLWPAWFWLISQCKPKVIFGEQVAGAVKQGWLDLVSADLEGEGYAFGAAVLGAHSVGAPHIRQRIWWVADSGSERQYGEHIFRQRRQDIFEAAGCSSSSRFGHSSSSRANGKPREILGTQEEACWEMWSELDLIECADGKSRPVKPGIQPLAHGVSKRVAKLRSIGNAIVPQVAATFIRSVM